MKVLKQGNFEGVFPMEVMCGEGLDSDSAVDYCGSLLEVSAEDIIRTSEDTDYCGIICPICGQFTYIPSEEIPEIVRKKSKRV